MGISMSRLCSVYPENTSVEAPNPDPLNFKILMVKEFISASVALIQYPDCTNFEGLKICVFLNMTEERLRDLHTLDPHFSEDSTSPIARFQPTGYGLLLAYTLAGNI